MGIMNYIKSKLLGDRFNGKSFVFSSLEDCVAKTFEKLGIDTLHDNDKFALDFQGNRCVFKVGLNCLEGNRLMAYVLYPMEIPEDVAYAAVYEVKRIKKIVTANLPGTDLGMKQDGEGFRIFACAVKGFETLSSEACNDIFTTMTNTADILDYKNFDSLAAAICGYKSCEEAKESMHAVSAEKNITLHLEDSYHRLLAETPNIGRSRYLGRLLVYAQNIIENKGDDNVKGVVANKQITYDDYIQEAYNIADDNERDLIRKLRFLGKAKGQDESTENFDSFLGKLEARGIISENPWNLICKEDKEDEEISGLCKEKWLYLRLSANQYKEYPYEQRDLGESIGLVNQVIAGYWKPRYLLDHDAKTAYEFMSASEILTNVTDEDIDWDSIKDLPQDVVERVKYHSFHFPGCIYKYENGIADVRWEINPDGMYYRDEDGFGMTNDVEINLEGAIDRQGKVVRKFTLEK